MVTDTIKQGYKQTEVGIIPNDWNVQNILDNSTLKGRIGWQGLTTAEYLDKGDYFLVTGTDFKDGKIDWEHCFYVDEKRYSQDKNIQLKVGDVLVTKDGTIGKIAYINNLPLPTTLNSGVFVIRPINNDYVTQFLYYILSSDFFERFLNKLKAGSTISHLYQKDFVSFDFILPKTKEEQLAIVSALSDTDSLIEQLDKLITKKKNVKQGAMQELLTGKRRLSGFKGEWEVKKLGEIADIKTGKKNNEDKMEEGLYPFFVRSQTVERINSYSYDGEAILVPGEGGIGNIFHYINGKFDYHQRVYKISNFVEDISGKFIYFHMLYNFHKQATKNSVKATVDSLRLPTFQEFELNIPKLKDEQIAITQVLSDIDLEIEELEQKRDKYLKLKTGMMQQLLTGRVRLKWKN